MFIKIKEMKNGYIIDGYSTNEEWQEICKKYNPIRCIICNFQTSKHFRIPLFGKNNITINNKLLDNVVYINGVY